MTSTRKASGGSDSKNILAVAATFGVIVLAGCSSGSGSPVSQGTASFPNPVTIVTEAGATPDGGAVNGSMSFDGTFKVASGSYAGAGGQTITVKTFKTKADQQSELDANAGQGPQDGQSTIVSYTPPLCVVYVYAATNSTSNGYNPFDPTLDIIAGNIGGTVLSGQ